MSQQRGNTETDQIANVIQVIQLGRKTGRLTIERGTEPFLESGEIWFIHGQITYVSVGHDKRLSGQRALKRLQSWGPCRFGFDPSATGHPERITQPLSAIGHMTTRTPSQPLRETNPHLRSASTQLPHETYRTTDPDQREEHIYVPQRIGYVANTEHTARLLNHTGLSRTHLHLLLLIDGRRTIPELVRLMGRTQDEIYHLLRDLEYIGIIR